MLNIHKSHLNALAQNSIVHLRMSTELSVTKAIVRVGQDSGNAHVVEIEGMERDLPEPRWPRIVDEIAAHVRLQYRE